MTNHSSPDYALLLILQIYNCFSTVSLCRENRITIGILRDAKKKRGMMTERREAGINSIGKKKPDLKPQLSDQTRFREKSKSGN